MRYEELIQRNKAHIPSSLQKKIRKCKILLIGCGLGSQIALLATRTGFKNFILADGDAVSIHNLNRQAFLSYHLNQNKAEATKDLIKKINPTAKVETYPYFLKSFKKAKELIEKSDVVVNMADPGKIMFFVNRYAQKLGKPVFFPLNIAWGGYVLVFFKNSPTLEEIIGSSKNLRGNYFYRRLLEKTMTTFPDYLLEFYQKKGRKLLKETYFPQLGVTSYLTAAIIVEGIVKYLAKAALRSAPHPIFLDLWEESE
jgi:molybdopterin/thiamine biosynthesis adenylyltransferase